MRSFRYRSPDPAKFFSLTHPGPVLFRYIGRIFNANDVVPSDAVIRPGYQGWLGYTYGPAIVRTGGQWHMLCGSADYWWQTHPDGGQDQIRYSSSADGVT